MSSEQHLLTVDVELIGTAPKVWRRIEVDASLPLDRLHQLLQSAMGWPDFHGHAFVDHDPFEPPSGRLSIVPRVWHDQGVLVQGAQVFDETSETLDRALGFGGGVLWYEYDFGDGWVHVIREAIRRPRSTDDPEARVVDGARRAPLEDCGGISGWADLLGIWAGRADAAEHADALAWIEDVQGFGRPFDPDDFDAEAATGGLRARRRQTADDRNASDPRHRRRRGSRPFRTRAGPDRRLPRWGRPGGKTSRRTASGRDWK